jgi:hypothetical protein
MSQAKRAIPSRTHFQSDKMYDTFQYFDIHPNKIPVFFDDTKILSMELRWPYESGVVETEDEIRIPTSSDQFHKLHNYDSGRFMVYIWYATGRIGIGRGMFSLSKPPGSKFFILKREVGVEDSASKVADEVMAEVNTKYALAEALEMARSDFEEPTNLPSTDDEEPPRKKVRPPPTPRKSVLVSGKFNGHSRKTLYKGCEYRSRSEAKMAVMMDAMNIPFSHEVMSFVRPNRQGRYTPDFFLPMQQLIVEYKPARPLIEEELKCEELSHTGFRVVLVYGDCDKMPFGYEHECRARLGRRDYTHKDGLRGMAWQDGEKLAGEVVFVVGKSPRKSPSPLEFFCDTDMPHLDTVCSSTDVRWDHPVIQSAVMTVKNGC